MTGRYCNKLNITRPAYIMRLRHSALRTPLYNEDRRYSKRSNYFIDAYRHAIAPMMKSMR